MVQMTEECDSPNDVDEPVLLGHVTAPSGALILLDAGLMNLWSHDRPPSLPEGTLSSEEKMADANNAKDLQIVGPDARAAGIAYNRGCHPLYIYDIPRSAVTEKVKHFEQFAKEKGFNAKLEPLGERISHRERITRLLDNGVLANGIEFHGIWAAVLPDAPKDKKLPVFGRRRKSDVEFGGRWHDVFIEISSETSVVRSESRGHAAVDEARLMFADTDALGEWVHEEPLDGKADFVFWGADAEAAAQATGATKFDAEKFGWNDLPVEDAAELGMNVERLREEHGWRFATDFRPHSHHWRAMTQVRNGDTRSGTVTVGSAEICLFMTSWGDGLFEVFADYDAQDRLVRFRVSLGSERTMNNVRAVFERHFGDFAKYALVSKRIYERGECVRFLYREDADREQDSGWRVFAGDESDDYANNTDNIELVPLRELFEKDKTLEDLFREPAGSVFEREQCDGAFVRVTDWEPRED